MHAAVGTVNGTGGCMQLLVLFTAPTGACTAGLIVTLSGLSDTKMVGYRYMMVSFFRTPEITVRDLSFVNIHGNLLFVFVSVKFVCIKHTITTKLKVCL